MRNFLIVLATFFISVFSTAQELNCSVKVIAQQTGNDQNVVFQTLEKQLTEFINNTQWTSKNFTQQQRINCSMVINVTNYDNANFSATLQVSSSRPVFNSTYQTPIYNFNDKSFNFTYLEFQNLVFNPQIFESNLISVLSFHVYMILGMDADSFALKGGDEYFKQAQTIANYSQQLAGQGWKLEDGLQSRFALINDVMSETFKAFRATLYSYHINGLDLMADNNKKAKENITTALSGLKAMHSKRPNSFLMRVFFDAKSDEVLDVFSGGPNINISETLATLNRIAPMHSQKWRQIKF